MDFPEEVRFGGYFLFIFVLLIKKKKKKQGNSPLAYRM